MKTNVYDDEHSVFYNTGEKNINEQNVSAYYVYYCSWRFIVNAGFDFRGF